MVILSASLALLTIAAMAFAEEPGDARQGKLLYEQYCALCHGAQGDGQGPYAEDTIPMPRDFRQGTFKWRSTPSGALPTDADLEKVLIDGLFGTSMSSFAAALGHQQRLDVIAYVKTFSPRFALEKPDVPKSMPAAPPYTAESAARGEVVYKTMHCAQCHGAEAHGDGESAEGLTDDWGKPIEPYDLTEGHLKGGNQGADIYRVLVNGLNGTPMPSFADSISPAEAWDLVHFIQSLSPDYPKD